MLPYLRKFPNCFCALVSPSHLTLIALSSVTQRDDSRNYQAPHQEFFFLAPTREVARSGAVRLGTALQAGKQRVRFFILLVFF
jgi:hypothetical protein